MDAKRPFAVRIEREGKLLKQSVVNSSPDRFFVDVVEQVLGPLPGGSDNIDELFVGSKSFEKEDLFLISPTSSIADASFAIGSCSKIVCILKPEIRQSKKVPNALEALMSNASALKYPEKRNENDGRNCIHNRLIDYLHLEKVGFRVFQKPEMDSFMSTIVAVLWYLDGQWEKIATAPGVSKIPQRLHFTPPDREMYRILHHGSQKKKSLAQLKTVDLIAHFNKLEELSCKKFIQAEGWNNVLDDINQLKTTIAEYIDHIKRAEENVIASRAAMLSHDDRILKILEGNANRSSLVKATYRHLEEVLAATPEYSELNMMMYAPIERRAKYRYISGIVFDFPVHVYRLFKPRATFIWRKTQEEDESALANVIARIETNINERVKKDKTTRLSNIFSDTVDWSSKKLNEFVLAVTDEDDVSENEMLHIAAGFQLLFEEGYSVIDAMDIEEQAQASKNEKFANFWCAVEQVLAANDYTLAEERRHGSTTWISPLCVSLRDLMQKCEKKMETLFPGCRENLIPSYEYFRLQFTPRNCNSLVGKRYYGRFDVKFGLQKRTLHKSHVDQHYGAKQFKYMKVMAGLFSDHALVYFLDDKASIPVGFESAPVSATRRQKRVLMAGLDDRGLNALDHDNIPQNITPSVSIKLIPPVELTDSWYKGKPLIILKDAIFEPSNAFRHVTELVNHTVVADYERPILFIGTDGGPDHKVTSIQVMLSYIALFSELDLDYLCAVRTPPNFSVINPAERFMSTANIALTGVSLARNHLGENEKLVCALLSKKQWRDADKKRPEIDYRKLALDGTKDARELLKQRFESLVYKGENVAVGEPATQEEINQMKKIIPDIWPEIDINEKLTKAQVMKSESVQLFFKNHVRATAYAFQVKKCKEIDCKFHKPLRLPTEVFDRILWLPTPERDGEKYKVFHSVHGSEPNDKEVPSKNAANSQQDKRHLKAPFPLAPTRARIVVFCTECLFPRLLYSKFAIEQERMVEIENFFEEKLFVCGSFLDSFPEIYQNTKLTCHDPVSCHYYKAGKSLSGYRDLCAECLDHQTVVTEGKVKLCERCNAKKNPDVGSYNAQIQRRPRGRPKKH